MGETWFVWQRIGETDAGCDVERSQAGGTMTGWSGKTSSSDPIRVDFLDPEAWRLPGRLGLTFAPGKKDPGRWDRDLEKDLIRLRREFGAHFLACLIEKDEFDLLEIPDLLQRASAHGLETEWFPIPDLGAPPILDGLAKLVDRILAAAAAGRTVVVHCRGGLGRAGLVAAACLVAVGHEPMAAIAAVRSVRPGAIETPVQERCVVEFAERRPARRAE